MMNRIDNKVRDNVLANMYKGIEMCKKKYLIHYLDHLHALRDGI
jgi:hypothetical protein